MNRDVDDLDDWADAGPGVGLADRTDPPATARHIHELIDWQRTIANNQQTQHAVMLQQVAELRGAVAQAHNTIRWLALIAAATLVLVLLGR